MRHLGCMLVGIVVMGLCQPDVGAQDKDKGKVMDRPAPSLKHLDGRTIVFVVNGVKGSTHVTDNLIWLNGDWALGLVIETIPWSRHDHRFKDLADNEAQLMAAHRLASATAAIRKDAPNAQIIYVGHSAGARIVLAAAEMSAPRSIDRIVLLNAAVSTLYDVRGALKASRHGVDNFYSSEDYVLQTAEEYHVLADGMRGRAAGRAGFHLPTDRKELEAYRMLRQYAWNASLNGNGGHFTWSNECSMKRTLIPLIMHTPRGEPVLVPPPAKIDKKKMPEAD